MSLNISIAFFLWDPPKEVFPWDVPLLGRPILWYGVLFALGFFLGYLVLCSLLKKIVNSRKLANQIAEQFLLFIGLGAIIGARLGDVFFYQDPHHWLAHPQEIFYIWEGGLASHGGAAGIAIAIILLARHLKKKFKIPFTFLTILDFAVIPAALGSACIRIGNFINQEILGTISDLPWSIIFLHPANGGPIIPRHPVQLYESLAYLVTFSVLFWLFKTKTYFQTEGKISGLFLTLVFGFRFFLEFFKEEQSALIGAHFPLTMGQLLSIPFFIWGIYLLLRKRSFHKHVRSPLHEA